MTMPSSVESRTELSTAEVTEFAEGGYRYLPAVFQYSGGVAASPGFAIERVRFRRPLPLAQGLTVVETYLEGIGRPTTAFCACQLRSPSQFSDQQFADFNRNYVRTLERWGVYRDGANPVARTNVCPTAERPATPVLHSFSYTVPTEGESRTFVIAGGAEAPERGEDYRDAIVRLGDTSLDGMREKMRYVREEQERRLEALGFSWRDARVVQAYSRHDFGPLVYSELLGRGVGVHGLTLYSASPPVADCEYEMDASTVLREVLL
ncbi:hypothetical protein GCM10023178_00570 [Actinomadura luteofluorescens]